MDIFQNYLLNWIKSILISIVKQTFYNMAFNAQTAAKAGSKSSRLGRPNKKTEALRGQIETLLEEQWEVVLEDIKALTPKERIDTIIKLLEYAMPKLNRTQVERTTSVEDLFRYTPEERPSVMK